MVTPSEQQLLEENMQLKKRIAELEHEEHQTRQQLSELDQLYRTALVGLCFVDKDLRFERINDRLAAMNGSPVEAHIGAHLRDMIPEIAKEVEPIYRRVIETGIPELDFEVVGVTSAASDERSCLVSYSPVKDGHGNVLGVSTVVQDITERKAVERALHESESRLRTIMDHAPEAIVVFDADTGLFVDANENAERLYGLQRDALFQVGPMLMSPPTQPDGRPSAESAHARIAEALEGQVPVFEWVHRNAEGKDIPCEVRLVRLPMMGRNLLRGSVTDITERKHARDSLQQAHDQLEDRVRQRTAELARSEERFELAIKGTSDGIWDWDILSGREWWSDQFHSLLGYKKGEIEARFQTFKQSLHAEDKASTLDAVQAHLEERVPYDVEFRLRTKSGDFRWFRSRGQAVWSETGRPVRMAGSIQDITDRKQFVEALKTNEQLLRQLLDVQEQERRMVAYDIHDGFAQDVVGAQMHVNSIHSKLDPSKLQERVDMAASLLSKAIAECRRMIHDLRPMVLDDEGIVEAIRHLIADEGKRASLVVAFDHDVQFDRLEPKLEGVIFRIVQEALNNVKKHGQTDCAAVQLNQQDGMLEVVVRDQGVGFDPERVPADRFGLRGIRERARLFGGAARIESAPGEGTTVYAQLRIDAKAAVS